MYFDLVVLSGSFSRPLIPPCMWYLGMISLLEYRWSRHHALCILAPQYTYQRLDLKCICFLLGLQDRLGVCGVRWRWCRWHAGCRSGPGPCLQLHQWWSGQSECFWSSHLCELTTCTHRGPWLWSNKQIVHLFKHFVHLFSDVQPSAQRWKAQCWECG